MKWKLKNPDGLIVLSNGGGTLHSSNLTDEVVEALVKANPNFLDKFVEVNPKPTAEKSKEEKEK